MSTRLERRVVPKAADYTVRPNSDAPGTVFTTEGATGAVVFTLPTPTRALLGVWYRFKNVVDQNMTVQPPTADTAIALNDLAADSLAVSTGGQKIGGEIEAQCVRTGGSTFQWALSGVAVGHTYTVAT
jgi:hypothetical protein